MTLTTPSAEALAATYDKLHRLGFKRDEDWFVQHEGLAWEEKIHIDMRDLGCLIRDRGRNRITPAMLAYQVSAPLTTPGSQHG